MMKTRLTTLLMALALVAIPLSNTARADSYDSAVATFKRSLAVRPFFEKSYGYAIFPTVGKGGFGVGAAYGKGKVYRQGQFAGTTELAKVSIGFQLGGQAFSEIIFFQDKRAYEDFTGGNFEFDATASAVAITAGAQAQAGTGGASAGASAGPATGTQTPTNYFKGMAIFIHAKGGLMYEASIGGQKFTFEPAK